MALCTLDSLLQCLDVRSTGAGHWTAPNLDLDYHRIFGGQLLAQVVAVASASGEGKEVTSMSVRFPREGATDTEVDFAVESVHDGRSVAVRRVEARQGERVCGVADVTLWAPGSGLEHQASATELGGGLADASGPDEAAETADLSMVPWEVRVVDGVDLRSAAAAPPTFAFWMRAGDRRLPDELHVHQALLAHATDLTMIGTALRPHEGYSQADSGTLLATAVTGHSLWFHRPFRLDDWCLVAQHAPISAGGRAFGMGHVFDAERRLVASFTQDAMIRPL